MDIPLVLSNYYREQVWSLNGDEYDGLSWSDTNTLSKPTIEDLQEKWSQIEEEKPWKELREERNKRLTQCDWVATRAFSTNTPIPEEWKTYMQALRDLPANTTDPENPVWPEAPTP